MDLETMTDIARYGACAIVYIGMCIPLVYIDRTTKRIIRDTTKVLDIATAYFATRVSNPKDIKDFHQLARTRREYGI